MKTQRTETEVQQELILILDSLGRGAPPEQPFSGICKVISKLTWGFLELEERTKQLMTEWPQYSGNTMYPIPHYKGPGTGYLSTVDLWGEDTYGALRRELCLYLSEKLTELMERDS